jgi:hypothetical protein
MKTKYIYNKNNNKNKVNYKNTLTTKKLYFFFVNLCFYNILYNC